MVATTPLKKMFLTYYKDNIPRISIQFIDISGEKEKIGFLYKDAILDSGSNMLSIPEDIAESLNLEIVEKVKNVETANGKKKIKIQIANNVSFMISDGKGNYVRYDEEKARIAKDNTSILVGTDSVFQSYVIIFIASKKLTILKPIK